MANIRLTRHNGRCSREGVFSPKHNDRRFNLGNASHIDSTKTSENVCWDIFNGVHTGDASKETSMESTFEYVEKSYYAQKFQQYIEGQNERNRRTGHSERNRTSEDIRHDRRTCPEESVFQLGTMENHTPPELLMAIATDFFTEFERRYGKNISVLDWSLHLDESTPHLHSRHVFFCQNQYGETAPLQEKALERLGFELPYPDKKPGRYNNRKMVFDCECRSLLFDIAKKHGLELEEEPSAASKTHMEKQEFIVAKQRKRIEEQQKTIEDLQSIIADQGTMIDSQETEIKQNTQNIVNQENKLNELVLKTTDLEALINDVSEEAYTLAVDVVSDLACQETQKQDIKLIEGTKDWLMSPSQKESQSKREYASSMLDHTISKLQKYSERVLQAVRKILMSPQKRKECIEAIKNKTKESIFKRINKNKKKVEEQDRKQPSIFPERQDQQAL